MLPFKEMTGIDHRVYSKRICRLMVDFASEESFERAERQMLEHHGLEVPRSCIYRQTVEAATKAEALIDSESLPTDDGPGQSHALVLEMDGLMVPIVTQRPKENGKVKKDLHWMELKIGAVHDPDKIKPKYAASFQDTDALGDRLFNLLRPHRHLKSVHGLGDGATWIPEQGERAAGASYNHLVDFYHLSQYIHNAFDGLPRSAMLVHRCKEELKAGQLPKVMRRLYRHYKKTPEHQGAADCIKYIKNRPGQFDYAGAIAKDLPIGSGMIESTNRSLMQKRLKKPGAWWSKENIRKMAALRVLRANEHWEHLWECAA